MAVIRRLFALVILDSLGRPTLQATCELADGASASASVPSGASTGAAEAHELRDGDPRRYGGLGCRTAVHNVVALNNVMTNQDFLTQADLDRTLIELDGTPDKSQLGANAILAVSIAYARADSTARGLPLYRHLASAL